MPPPIFTTTTRIDDVLMLTSSHKGIAYSTVYIHRPVGPFLSNYLREYSSKTRFARLATTTIPPQAPRSTPSGSNIHTAGEGFLMAHDTTAAAQEASCSAQPNWVYRRVTSRCRARQQRNVPVSLPWRIRSSAMHPEATHLWGSITSCFCNSPSSFCLPTPHCEEAYYSFHCHMEYLALHICIASQPPRRRLVD